MGKLDGKVCIITGATSGMGRDSAKLFAAEGAKVVVTGRSEERAKEVVDEIKAAGGDAIYVIVDMANLSEIHKVFDAAMEKYGTVDVLFNNHGMLSLSPFMQLTPEEWTKVLNVNVSSTLFLSQLVVPVMKKKGKGVIINTCSVASFGAHNAFAPYVASKHAISGLTKSMAWELGPEIRCNGIAPGLVHTPMVDSIGGPAALQHMIDSCPVKRCGKPDDIARLALFLATDESSFIDGQIIKADGGYEV